MDRRFSSLPLSPFWAVLSVVILAWLLKALYRAYSTPLRRIPGPWYGKFTHLWLKVQNLKGCRIYYLHALHARYGPIVRVTPHEIAVADFDSFREIHKIGSGYVKSPWYESITGEDLPGVFSMTDTKQHARRRQLLARGFSKTYLRQHWERAVRERATLAVAKLKRDAQNDVADILKWWTFYTTDVITQLSFGESFHMLEHEKKNDYIRILETALLAAGIGVELPPVRAIGKYFPVASIRKLFRTNDDLVFYGAQAVANSKSQDSSTANLFATILAESDKNDGMLTPIEVNLEAKNLIVAGSDTTAITLTYLTWAVLRQPEIRKRLEDEVGALEPDFTEANLEELPYLNAVIEESLRLYGAAPGTMPRQTPAGGATFCGYYIPGNTTVSTQAFTIHRDPSLFENPEKFDPSRFLERGKLSARAYQALHSFGAGSRVCLGIHLARMELRLAASLFFRELKGAGLAATTTDESMWMDNFMLIAPRAHRCNVILRK